MVIAIDGPAGTGKSTIAKRIATHFNITFLNSGSFYRGITLLLLENNKDMQDFEAVCEFARKLTIDYINERLVIDKRDVDDLLHTDRVDQHVASLSSIPELRNIVNEKIRFITKSQSIVCEGRDMTTIVFPNADYKFYLDASLDVQAQRRFDQGLSELSLEEIKDAIRERDRIDKSKTVGALKKAEDAVYIDTSDLTIEEVCAIIVSKINI